MNGETLRRVREATGMLQPAFAAELGIHPVTLSKFERDVDRINLTVELAIYELASRLGVREVLPNPSLKKKSSSKK